MEFTPAPVILVPGISRSERSLGVLRRRLERAGFSHVALLPPPDLFHGLPALADQLARHIDVVRALTGASRVHLVAHNVGGIVARSYVQLLGGHEVVDIAVTVGTPHHGTHADLALGAPAAQLRPDSHVMRRLRTAPAPGVCWINFWCRSDLLVRPAAAGKLDVEGLEAVNVEVIEHTDLSLTIPPIVAHAVVEALLATEQYRDDRAPLLHLVP